MEPGRVLRRNANQTGLRVVCSFAWIGICHTIGISHFIATHFVWNRACVYVSLFPDAFIYASQFSLISIVPEPANFRVQTRAKSVKSLSITRL